MILITNLSLIIATDRCRLLLDSIETPRLRPFKVGALESCVVRKGTERHRVAGPVPRVESFVLPPDIVIGLRSIGPPGIQNLGNGVGIIYSRHCCDFST